MDPVIDYKRRLLAAVVRKYVDARLLLHVRFFESLCDYKQSYPPHALSLYDRALQRETLKRFSTLSYLEIADELHRICAKANITYEINEIPETP